MKPIGLISQGKLRYAQTPFSVPTFPTMSFDINKIQTYYLKPGASAFAAVSAAPAKRVQGKQRKEATATDTKQYHKQFTEAKTAEHKSWVENEVYELVDMRKVHCRNYVTGRWVLTIKRDKEGNFQKCKARWVLRGFQDKQKNDQQTDSPTVTRPGFRLACQLCATNGWSFGHIDLKAAFLQGEEYDWSRDVIRHLPTSA